ncbi:MAG: hypothetical protein GY715_09185 [Planctomycetes bacterium]|nr:hypothetical protein [Planctomycetota bacterium]
MKSTAASLLTGTALLALSMTGCTTAPAAAPVSAAPDVTPGMLGDEQADLRTEAMVLGAGDAYGEMVHAVYVAYQVRQELEMMAEVAETDAPE